MKKILFLFAASILSLTFINTASAVVVLPDPNAEFDGIAYASKIDDFYTFPASLMLEFGLPAADWDVVAGTGGLDVILYNGPGSSNIGVGTGAFTFESAIDAPGAGTSTFSGIWGNGVQVNGPVTVAKVLDYLEAQFGPGVTVPVFNFDSHEPNSSGEFLNVVGQVKILDTTNSNAVAASWSLDNVNDGIFDPTAWVTVPNTLVLTGDSSATYTIDNNRSGNARLDYSVFAPTMDLSPYDSTDYLFVVDLRFDQIDNGFEEVYLSGTFTPGTAVPEPATMSLFGIGLLGLAASRKRRISN
ncbi:MAG: PEP-CTERM sorting domain-containing protein [Candidatus Omnitrophica bacterium CG11_big_fil_rev_8_21_14_0_20_42_13]|uniref:PEP-CTERM sorting domain-containing protein n=1 Tax=Candidatus Ghiorseimicrobium undicola TaxID=1974746 RepID=A0A2H0LYL5_9BACT|nr:MAG: PEP-CTERM sorting domain-containing protein [Candidatus Omnitrophica bacterium CG11_big_fil_rev_8_21_14_0_20_42_13]